MLDELAEDLLPPLELGLQLAIVGFCGPPCYSVAKSYKWGPHLGGDEQHLNSHTFQADSAHSEMYQNWTSNHQNNGKSARKMVM